MFKVLLTILAALSMMQTVQASDLNLSDVEFAQEFDAELDAGLDGADLEQFRRGRGRGHGVRCVARNRSGRRFFGWHKRKVRKARRRALRACRQSSWRPGTCYVARCR